MRHGGDLAQASRQYGFTERDWLDLSTGINPRPWPGAAALGGPQLELDRLPSSASLEGLLAAARRAYGVPPGLSIAAAPGSESIIRALPRIVPGPAALAATSYGSYAEAWLQAGSCLDTAEAPEQAARCPEMTLIQVNPNNPDGRTLPTTTLLSLARSRRGGAHLIVDEAFAEGEDGVSIVPHLAGGDPVLVLKSFGKFFGLPGLRLGFAIGPPALLERLGAQFGDWPASGPALVVGRRALGDAGWQHEARSWLREQSRRLDAALTAAGLAVVGGTSLFRLVRHPEAAAIHQGLARQAIWTRIWPDAPELIRFGLPPHEAGLTRLRQALADLKVG
ncbi:MAG TPA: threonine-phosphate decarboxylase [Afifellaceae bacterium]|nr:threonine-phosphate decarboxylase [Afifellaceae bacterium]